ncbi:hypothetical protein ACFLXI_01385 [Chloroflexota bacterium]
MILVRTEFQCKFGRVQEAIDSFKAMAAGMNSQSVIKRTRLMTDLSGRFDTVIVESEVESIDAYFAMLHAAFADPEFQAGQPAPDDSPYQTGQRNFYTIEATYEAET